MLNVGQKGCLAGALPCLRPLCHAVLPHTRLPCCHPSCRCSHRSSYLRDYTCSEDRPHSAGVRPRLLSKVASANHASQREGDSDVEAEPWVLEGWKDEVSSVVRGPGQSRLLVRGCMVRASGHQLDASLDSTLA